jgi:hypothetical protein
VTDFSTETPEETVARLVIYTQRLHQNVAQARVLYACFQSLNENRDLHERIVKTPAGFASNMLMNSVLRELMMIIVRAFDKRGGYKLEKTDKVTFPIVAEWITREPIHDLLIQRARNWFDDGFNADKNEASVRKAIVNLNERLEKLQTEVPNREKRLRRFRDGFLAHDLHRPTPEDPPLFGYIVELLEEMRLLSESATLAIRGSEVSWELLDEDVKRSADWLWQKVGEEEVDDELDHIHSPATPSPQNLSGHHEGSSPDHKPKRLGILDRLCALFGARGRNT